MKWTPGPERKRVVQTVAVTINISGLSMTMRHMSPFWPDAGYSFIYINSSKGWRLLNWLVMIPVSIFSFFAGLLNSLGLQLLPVSFYNYLPWVIFLGFTSRPLLVSLFPSVSRLLSILFVNFVSSANQLAACLCAPSNLPSFPSSSDHPVCPSLPVTSLYISVLGRSVLPVCILIIVY